MNYAAQTIANPAFTLPAVYNGYYTVHVDTTAATHVIVITPVRSYDWTVRSQRVSRRTPRPSASCRCSSDSGEV